MSAPRSIATSRYLYARLLRLLPGEFRSQYGQPALQTFLDLLTAEVKRRGMRGALAVWRAALPDLVYTATCEYAVRLRRDGVGGRPPVGARLAAALVPAAAVLVVASSQALYPANLALPEYAIGYAVLAAALGVLAVVLATSRVATPTVVVCGLATAPGWVLAFHAGRPGALVVGVLPAVSLIVIASVSAARGVGEAVRAGAVTGTLGGIIVVVVTVLDGLLTMRSVGQDRIYVAEFQHSGQHSLAAYVLGERIFGGVMMTVMAVVLGTLLGFAVAVATARRRRARATSA
jgi:hypothetical protein